MPMIRGLSIYDYHADPVFVSHSKLKDFANKGARYYQERYLLGTIARKETNALRFGNAFEAVFQRDGDALDKDFAIEPEKFDGRTKAGKAWVAAAAQQGKTIISHEDYLSILTMVERARECQSAMMRIDDACEQQVTLRGEAFGLSMQSRPDWLRLQGTMLSNYLPYTIDLKSTKDLADLDVRDGITSLGYHTQAALARALLKVCMGELGIPYEGSEHFIFAVSKEYPHASRLYRCPTRVLDWADNFLGKHCAALSTCLQTDVWPLAIEEIGEVRIPRWAESNTVVPAVENDFCEPSADYA